MSNIHRVKGTRGGIREIKQEEELMKSMIILMIVVDTESKLQAGKE
jgi:hypothetical protein